MIAGAEAATSEGSKATDDPDRSFPGGRVSCARSCGQEISVDRHAP